MEDWHRCQGTGVCQETFSDGEETVGLFDSGFSRPIRAATPPNKILLKKMGGVGGFLF